MKKRFALLGALLLTASLTHAQVDLQKEFFSLPDSVTHAYLDTVKVEMKAPNDYWMAGVYGGASLQYGFFNPDRLVEWQLQYPVYGFSLIRHYTMFGIFPNMGLEFGAQLNYEGYRFKKNKETLKRATESGAYAALITVPEAFMLSHFHLDFGDHVKLMAKVGLYGGYRLRISRRLDEAFVGGSEEQYVNEFRNYDRRYSYGVMGGVGMGAMLGRFEIHLMANIKWGWSSFWAPDYASPYYYRYAYPLDGAITLGAYYQLTPRNGHSDAQLRALARKLVAGQQNP